MDNALTPQQRHVPHLRERAAHAGNPLLVSRLSYIRAISALARTWFWKDDLHFARRLYYGKIIAGQPSIIAPGYLADFIAALAGWGLERERDPIKLYLDGRLSREARAICARCTIHPGTARYRIRGQLRIFGIESSTQLESKLFLWR